MSAAATRLAASRQPLPYRRRGPGLAAVIARPLLTATVIGFASRSLPGQRLTDPLGKEQNYFNRRPEEQFSAKLVEAKLFPAPRKRLAGGRTARTKLCNPTPPITTDCPGSPTCIWAGPSAGSSCHNLPAGLPEPLRADDHAAADRRHRGVDNATVVELLRLLEKVHLLRHEPGLSTTAPQTFRSTSARPVAGAATGGARSRRWPDRR